MCGRYVMMLSPEELADGFGLPDAPETVPRYNVAPSQLVAVVGQKPDTQQRGLVMMKWGLVPRWAKSPTDGPRPINAKAETIRSKAPFRDSFRSRRCLIPASGFYEWQPTEAKTKQPYFFRFTKPPAAFAGVWDVWQSSNDSPLFTCAIITVPANEMVAAFHDRMPAVLRAEQFDRWLSNTTPLEELEAMLQPLPVDEMEAVRVGPLVNSPKHDGPECLNPAA